MGRTHSIGAALAIVLLLAGTGCGSGDGALRLDAQHEITTGTLTGDIAAAPGHAASGFTLSVAPETFGDADAVELSLELTEVGDYVTASITAPAGAELSALCCSVDYDAEAYTPVEAEWLADFAQSDDCLKLEQLAIAGTAYLGCVPVGSGTGTLPAEKGSGGLSAAAGGHGGPPYQEIVPLASVRFKRGSFAGKGASVVADQAGLISNECLNLTERALYWDTAILAGDYDGNGEVGFAELVLIGQHYLEHPTEETGYSSTYMQDGVEITRWRFNEGTLQRSLDYINDGEINQADMLGLVENFGKAITEWRVYTSTSEADYPEAQVEDGDSAPAGTMVAVVSNADRDSAKTCGYNFGITLPALPDGSFIWIRPWAENAAGNASGLLQYDTRGLSSIRVEYDAEMMQYYGGLPEETTFEFWSKPGVELQVQINASAGPELYIGDIYFDGILLAPSPNLGTSEEYTLGNTSFSVASTDSNKIRFFSMSANGYDGSSGWTLTLLFEPESRVAHQYRGVLGCGPELRDKSAYCYGIVFDAGSTWDAESRTISWLYCGLGDATQDGVCSRVDDFAMIPYHFGEYDSDINSISYLADYDHNIEVGTTDLQVIAFYADYAHDGYNMYYGAPGAEESSELIYAGHVDLSEGVGNRYVERLRFSFQYPEEVGPGDALFYCPTLDGEEGFLAWLYTVPEEE